MIQNTAVRSSPAYLAMLRLVSAEKSQYNHRSWVPQMPRKVSNTTKSGWPRCLAFGHLGNLRTQSDQRIAPSAIPQSSPPAPHAKSLAKNLLL